MHGPFRFRTIALLFVLGILCLPVSSLAAQAKNIILLIGDGMGPTHFGAAWLYSNRVLGKELRMVEAMKSGRTAYAVKDTADLRHQFPPACHDPSSLIKGQGL